MTGPVSTPTRRWIYGTAIGVVTAVAIFLVAYIRSEDTTGDRGATWIALEQQVAVITVWIATVLALVFLHVREQRRRHR